MRCTLSTLCRRDPRAAWIAVIGLLVLVACGDSPTEPADLEAGRYAVTATFYPDDPDRTPLFAMGDVEIEIAVSEPVDSASFSVIASRRTSPGGSVSESIVRTGPVRKASTLSQGWRLEILLDEPGNPARPSYYIVTLSREGNGASCSAIAVRYDGASSYHDDRCTVERG